MAIASTRGTTLVAHGTATAGCGLEMAYRSCHPDFAPLVNVGWKCRGRQMQPPWDLLERHCARQGIDYALLTSAMDFIVTGRGFITLRDAGSRCDVFAEVRRCSLLTGHPQSQRLVSLIQERVVRDSPALESMAGYLDHEVHSGRIASVIVAWEAVGSNVIGRSLYLNCGHDGRFALWELIKQAFPADKQTAMADFLTRARCGASPGVMYFKASDDGSASVHVRGLGWEEVEAWSREFAGTPFTAGLRLLYDEPPDVLAVSARADGTVYCTAYFQYYFISGRAAT